MYTRLLLRLCALLSTIRKGGFTGGCKAGHSDQADRYVCADLSAQIIASTAVVDGVVPLLCDRGERAGGRKGGMFLVAESYLMTMYARLVLLLGA